MVWGEKTRDQFRSNQLISFTLFIFLSVVLIASPVYATTRNLTLKTADTPAEQLSPIVKTVNSQTVYFLNEDKIYSIDHYSVLSDFNSIGPIRIVDKSFIESKAYGGILSRVVGSTADSNIYLINAGIRLRFPSCELVQEYGFDCSNLIRLTPDQLSRFYPGPSVTQFVKSVSSSTVYFVTQGVKRPIASWGDLLGLGVPFVINVFTNEFINAIPTGEVLLSGGSLIKTPNTATVYAIKNWKTSPSVYPVTSFENTLDLGLGTDVKVINQNQFSRYSVESILKTTLKCNDNNYVGLNGLLYQVGTAELADFGYTNADFIDGADICNRANFSSSSLSRFILNRGSIYLVENGKKRGFTSYRAYIENGGNPATTISVSNSFADRLPNGNLFYASIPRGEVAIRNDIYDRVNAERAARGLTPLGWNAYLSDSARNWSVQMANSNSFAHSNLYPLLSQFYVVAENIGLAGAGAKSGAIHTAWMNSTGHRVNLLGRNLDVIGIGVYCAPDGRMWVTQQFGRWPGSALPTTFGPTPAVNPIVAGDGGGAIC